MCITNITWTSRREILSNHALSNTFSKVPRHTYSFLFIQEERKSYQRLRESMNLKEYISILAVLTPSVQAQKGNVFKDINCQHSKFHSKPWWEGRGGHVIQGGPPDSLLANQDRLQQHLLLHQLEASGSKLIFSVHTLVNPQLRSLSHLLQPVTQ